MLGKEYLGAPVLFPNTTARQVYLPTLPSGEVWAPVGTNGTGIGGGERETSGAVEGGQTVVAPAPLDTLLLFRRVKSKIGSGGRLL